MSSSPARVPLIIVIVAVAVVLLLLAFVRGNQVATFVGEELVGPTEEPVTVDETTAPPEVIAETAVRGKVWNLHLTYTGEGTITVTVTSENGTKQVVLEGGKEKNIPNLRGTATVSYGTTEQPYTPPTDGIDGSGEFP